MCAWLWACLGRAGSRHQWHLTHVNPGLCAALLGALLGSDLQSQAQTATSHTVTLLHTVGPLVTNRKASGGCRAT